MGDQGQHGEPEGGFRDWWYGRAGGMAGLVTAVVGGVGLGAVVGAFIGMMLQAVPAVPDGQAVTRVAATITALIGGAEAVRVWRFARQHGNSADPWESR